MALTLMSVRGEWIVDDLSLLAIKAPLHSDVDFDLTVKAISTETSNGSTAMTSELLHIDVIAVADDPTLTVTDVTASGATSGSGGAEETPGGGDVDVGNDSTIPGSETSVPGGIDGGGSTTSGNVVDLSGKIVAALTDLDGSETLSVHLSGVPVGSSLMGATFDSSSGDWIVNDLSNLKITPPANTTSFDLTVKAISEEASNGDSAMTSATLHVLINTVADAPSLTVSGASGDEDTMIDLSAKINAVLTDTDGSESLAIHIADVPTGASLNGATFDSVSGDWIVDDLPLLAIKAPLHSDVDFDLTVKAISTETSNGSTAMTSELLHIDVIAVADDPTLTVTDVTVSGATSGSGGAEETPGGGDVDVGNDSTIPGSETSVPGGIDGGGSTTSENVVDLSGKIVAALTDLDGSETLSVHLSGVPVGSSLMGATFDSSSGDWIVNDLSNLKITPPANTTSFDLTVKAISEEASNGDSAMTSATLHVLINGSGTPPVSIMFSLDDPNIPTALAANPESILISGKAPIGSNVDIVNADSNAIVAAALVVNTTDGSWSFTDTTFGAGLNHYDIINSTTAGHIDLFFRDGYGELTGNNGVAGLNFETVTIVQSITLPAPTAPVPLANGAAGADLIDTHTISIDGIYGIVDDGYWNVLGGNGGIGGDPPPGVDPVVVTDPGDIGDINTTYVFTLPASDGGAGGSTTMNSSLLGGMGNDTIHVHAITVTGGDAGDVGGPSTLDGLGGVGGNAFANLYVNSGDGHDIIYTPDVVLNHGLTKLETLGTTTYTVLGGTANFSENIAAGGGDDFIYAANASLGSGNTFSATFDGGIGNDTISFKNLTDSTVDFIDANNGLYSNLVSVESLDLGIGKTINIDDAAIANLTTSNQTSNTLMVKGDATSVVNLNLNGASYTATASATHTDYAFTFNSNTYHLQVDNNIQSSNIHIA
jgi:hypothetical protein